MLQPIILAGGSGTRLWPLSRQAYPKQFLTLLDNQHSLFQHTLLRLNDIQQTTAPLIVCNEQHYFICSEQLKAINNNEAHYILEPMGRNTAPALAIAAFHALSQSSSDSYFLVMPSDHLIKDTLAFNQAVTLAMQAAAENHIVTFSIIPTHAETGYGYIECHDMLHLQGVYKVSQFIEKPDLLRANQFLAAKNYYWNSGIFLFKANVYLQELQKYAAPIYETAQTAYQQAIHKNNTLRLKKESFVECPHQSIDIAVMEKTSHAVTIPLSVGWSDLGCWNAVGMANPKDENNNVIQGDVLAQDTYNCFIHTSHKLVATAGLKDHIVINSDDGVLVVHKDHAQSVKNLVQELQKMQHKTVETLPKVHRPWGYYETLTETPCLKVKQLVVHPGGSLSLQLHHHRSEHWVIVEGIADIICGEETLQLIHNQYIFIPPKTKHRLTNRSNLPLVVIETQLGHYLGEDDIIRFDDIYARDQ